MAAEKAADTRRVFYNVPCVIAHFHFDQDVTGEELMRGVYFRTFSNFDNLFGRNQNLKDAVVHLFQNSLLTNGFSNFIL